MMCQVGKASPDPDSLHQELRHTSDLSTQVAILLDLSDSYRRTMPDSAIHYAEAVLELTDTRSLSNERIQALIKLGVLHKRNGAYIEALDYYREALYLYLELQDAKGVADTYDRMAVVFRYLGEYEDALDYHHKSIEIAQEFEDPEPLGRYYSNLANLYTERSNYDLALAYYSNSLSIRKDLKDTIGIARISNNLANAHYLQESYLEARQYYERSLALFQHLGYEGEQARILSNLGNLAYQENQQETALGYWTESLFLARRLQDQQTQMTLLHQMGLLYLEQRQWKQAADALKQATDLAKDMEQGEVLADLYPDLAKAYRQTGKQEQAFSLLNRSLILKDSLDDIHGQERFNELTALYETERTERQLAETKQQLAESRKTQILLGSGILVLLLLACIAGIVFYNHRKIQQSERQLSIQKEELNRQIIIDLMKAQEVESLNAMLEGQEQERQRIAADLHDSLGGTLAAVKVSLFTLQKKLSGQPEDTSTAYSHTRDLLEEAYKEVRRISHNLADNTLEHEGLGSALLRLCETLQQHSGLQMNLETSGLEEAGLDSRTEVQLYRIVQELFQNIIKHADAEKVSIQLSSHRDRLNVMVEDDGVGFEYEPGQNKEGIGLHNLSRRVKQLKGTLEIDSAPGQGTTTIIDIPL